MKLKRKICFFSNKKEHQKLHKSLKSQRLKKSCDDGKKKDKKMRQRFKHKTIELLTGKTKYKKLIAIDKKCNFTTFEYNQRHEVSTLKNSENLKD